MFDQVPQKTFEKETNFTELRIKVVFLSYIYV